MCTPTFAAHYGYSMKKITLLYTIASGIFWETAYALVIIGGGLLLAFLIKYIK